MITSPWLCLSRSYHREAYLVRFFRYVENPSDSLDAHIGQLDSMRADLLDMDFEVDEDIFLATIIESLPAEYGNAGWNRGN